MWPSGLVLPVSPVFTIMWTKARCFKFHDFLVSYLKSKVLSKIHSSLNSTITGVLRNHMWNKYCGQDKNLIPPSFHTLNIKKTFPKVFSQASWKSSIAEYQKRKPYQNIINNERTVQSTSFKKDTPRKMTNSLAFVLFFVKVSSRIFGWTGNKIVF